jgi:cysteine synthase A
MLQLGHRLWAKAEFCQKTGSVKDRFVFVAVSTAIEDGSISTGMTLVEATSGNTGISLAAAGAAIGAPVEIIMPCNMSRERKDMMRRFGANVIEVGASDFHGAIKLRNEMIDSDSRYWSPMQFESRLNIEVHQKVTAPEIYRDMKEIGMADWDFVSGAGTGGTLMGIYNWMQNRSEIGTDHRIVQVSPTEPANEHGIQGINDGADFLLQPELMHEVIEVRTHQAIRAAQQFAKSHGFLVGVSTGANLVAARRYISANPKRNVVTLLCDRGERYFSLA